MSTAPPPSDDLVLLLRGGSAPREIRAFAARGLLPLEPDDALRALLAVLRDPDPENAATARQTLRAESPDRLATFVRSATPLPAELDALSRESDDPFVQEEIVRSRKVEDSTLLHLAQTATGRPQEALIANQSRLIAQPALVAALRANPALTAEGRRLLAEFTEEFLDKGARKLAADARRGGEELVDSEEAAEDLDNDGYVDDGDIEPSAGSVEPKSAESASENDSLFVGALYRRIALMTVHEKIDLAYKGNREERRILISDSNKLIGLAVLKSRGLTDSDVEGFATMRNLDEEIYRRITKNREWMRRPAVGLALVRNPRVPLDVTLPLVKRLSMRELRDVRRDRNLAPVIRTAASRILIEKRR